MFHSLLGCLGVKLAKRNNKRYSEADLTNMVIVMAKNKVSANSAYKNGPKNVKIPGGDWLLKKIRRISMKKMVPVCDKMITQSAKAGGLRRHQRGNKFNQCQIAIDKTKKGNYDKNPDMRYLIHSKKEAGTYTFESHITAKVVSGTDVVTLHSELVTRDDFNSEFVRRTIKKCSSYRIGASLYLLDREFYSTDVMRAIREQHKDYITPAIKNEGTKRAISELVQGKRAAVSKYTISNGTQSHTFTLVIIPSNNPKAKNIFDRYHVFATSLPCKDLAEFLRRIPELYKGRWGIETGYKSSKSVTPRTTSKNPAIRLFMFTITIILANIWMWLRSETAKQTYDVDLVSCLNQMINSFDGTNHSKWPPPT